MIGVCCRCYDEGVEVYPSNCLEKPEDLAGQPIGMYHCPDCGAMIIAGLRHPEMCNGCLSKTHPFMDASQP